MKGAGTGAGAVIGGPLPRVGRIRAAGDGDVAREVRHRGCAAQPGRRVDQDRGRVRIGGKAVALVAGGASIGVAAAATTTTASAVDVTAAATTGTTAGRSAAPAGAAV